MRSIAVGVVLCLGAAAPAGAWAGGTIAAPVPRAAFHVDGIPQLRLPIPDGPELEKAKKIVKETYGKRIDEATDKEKQKSLSHEILRTARETSNNPPARYVLLREAEGLATKAPDVRLVLDVIDARERYFDVDGESMRVAALRAIIDNAAATPVDKRDVTEAARSLMMQAGNKDHYDAAIELGRIAATAAEGTKQKLLMDEVTQLVAVLAETKRAAERIKTDPDDPTANLALGKHCCFWKGDWEKGLPMLRRGSDPSLRSVAEQELKAPFGAKEQAELGDAWCKLSDDAEGAMKTPLGERAAVWYKRALPFLTGLDKVRVEKRLEELKRPDRVAPPPGALTGTWRNAGGSSQVQIIDDGNATKVHAHETRTLLSLNGSLQRIDKPDILKGTIQIVHKADRLRKLRPLQVSAKVLNPDEMQFTYYNWPRFNPKGDFVGTYRCEENLKRLSSATVRAGP